MPGTLSQMPEVLAEKSRQYKATTSYTVWIFPIPVPGIAIPGHPLTHKQKARLSPGLIHLKDVV